jgi:hypothetical protein
MLCVSLDAWLSMLENRSSQREEFEDIRTKIRVRNMTIASGVCASPDCLVCAIITFDESLMIG